MSALKFEGQVALVTGASRGLGAAIALELAHRGLKVIGTATTDDGAARITQALAAWPDCTGRKLDVTEVVSAEALIDSIIKEHGGLHILVNNAGITRDMLAMRLKDDDWDAVLDTNLKAVFPADLLALNHYNRGARARQLPRCRQARIARANDRDIGA